MSLQITAPRRTLRRLGLAVAASTVAVIALPLPAQAHVEVQPGAVPGGDFAVVALRVPNERDDAATTKVRVILPRTPALGSVQTTAMPGWATRTVTRKLAKPIDMFGAKVDRVVSEVTWTATQGGVRPGQFQDFELSLGQLPTSGRLVFTALQTYGDGEVVRWNEVSADAAVEPEHPAPTLTLTAPEAEEGAADAGASGATAGSSPEGSAGVDVAVSAQATKAAKAAVAAQADDTPVLPTVLSAAALLVAVGAAGLAWRRGR
jgi:periplasmic copper chaperone A